LGSSRANVFLFDNARQNKALTIVTMISLLKEYVSFTKNIFFLGVMLSTCNR
jgi:hypothetical protein